MLEYYSYMYAYLFFFMLDYYFKYCTIFFEHDRKQILVLPPFFLIGPSIANSRYLDVGVHTKLLISQTNISGPRKFTSIYMYTTVEFQWLEHPWDHEN